MMQITFLGNNLLETKKRGAGMAPAPLIDAVFGQSEREENIRDRPQYRCYLPSRWAEPSSCASRSNRNRVIPRVNPSNKSLIAVAILISPLTIPVVNQLPGRGPVCSFVDDNMGLIVRRNNCPIVISDMQALHGRLT